MKPSYVKKSLGIVASIATLIVGSFLFIFLFWAVAWSSDAGPSNAPIRMIIGWGNIIGTPILSLTAVTYILKKTWSKKFALWTIIFIVFSLVVFFVTYIYPRFFLGLE
jgi:hypothetical protein